MAVRKSIRGIMHRYKWLITLLVIGSSIIETHLSAQVTLEICDNAIDDDGDGLIDINDDDCVCIIIEPASLIPNPSFEEQDCCPSEGRRLDCASGWIQASEPTTDYLHTCGWLGWVNSPPPLPFPDGEGIMGFRDGRINNGVSSPSWKEYAGACLLSPLLAGETYRFAFDLGFIDQRRSPPIEITFFGTTDCDYLPFGVGNENLGCPTNGLNWVRLGSKRVSSTTSASWVKTFIEVVPFDDIKAIAIGPSCDASSSTQGSYYFFDDLLLDDARAFDFVISEVNHPCSEDFSLAIPEVSGLHYQWYKEGIALIGETATQLTQIYGEGAYQIRSISNNGSCSLTSKFHYKAPSSTTMDFVNICEGEMYSFGNQNISELGLYKETFKDVNNCDSTVVLEVSITPLDAGTITKKIFEGEKFKIENFELDKKGEYPIRIESSIGCDSLITINLEYYHVYFPNILNPSSTIGNNRFMVTGNNDIQEVSSLVVFNRWGQQVYADSDLLSKKSEGWNGRLTDQNIQPGVYIYVAKVVMSDGKERMFKGDIMILF